MAVSRRSVLRWSLSSAGLAATAAVAGTAWAAADYESGATVQRELDAAAAGETPTDDAGRHIAKIGGGPYLLTEPLIIAGNTHLDVTDVRLIADFPAGVTGTMLLNKVAADTGDYDAPGNIAITGGSWDPVWYQLRRGDDPRPMNILTLIHTTDVEIIDAELWNTKWWHAVELNAVSGATVRGCQLRGWIADPNVGLWHGEAIQLDMPVDSNTWAGLADATPCRDITITDNLCAPSGSQAGWGKLLGSHTSEPGAVHSGVVIDGNTVEDAVWDGIGPMNTQELTITNNVLRRCEGGIYVKSIDNPLQTVEITENEITDCGDRHALGVFGTPDAGITDALVAGNTAEPCTTVYEHAEFREPPQDCG